MVSIVEIVGSEEMRSKSSLEDCLHLLPRIAFQQALKIRDGLLKPFSQRHGGLPTKLTICLSDIGSALLRVVTRQRAEDHLRLGSSNIEDNFSKFENGEFSWIAEINRTRHVIRRVHELYESFDQVVHVTEGTCLTSVTENGYVAVEQCLDNEARDHSAVMGVRPRSISVEDACNLDGDPMLPPIVEE